MGSLTGGFQRIVGWYRGLKTPKHVEKASRRERWKREGWQLASTVLAAAVVVASYMITEVSVDLPGAAGPAVLAWLLLDKRLFTWGFERFELVAPWQFRDAEVADEQ